MKNTLIIHIFFYIIIIALLFSEGKKDYRNSDIEKTLEDQKRIFKQDLKESILAFESDSIFIPDWIEEN